MIKSEPHIDGSLSNRFDTVQQAKIAVMAKILIEHGAYAEERAAIRVLSGRGYGQGEIIKLVDAARELAAKTP